MPVGRKTIGSSKSLDTWNNRDFLIYFSDKLKESSGSGLRLEAAVEWLGFISRIKGFRVKLNLNNVQYKDFIDKVFLHFFSQDKYTPTFGAIVSERVFNISKKYFSSSRPLYSDFEKVREELYGNNLLFKKLL
jgi:hypothetical protein